MEGKELSRSLMRKEDREYRREQTAWMPVWAASVIGRVFFFPTLFYNVSLYYLQPRKFKKWWNRIDDNVVLGALPFYWHCSDYFAEGIRGVVNTCDEYAGPWRTYQKHGIKQLRLKIVDYYPPTLEDVEKGVEFIQEHVQNGDSVLVHCKAGRGRSSTIVLCYLIDRYGLTPKEAQDVLCFYRPQVAQVWKRRVVYEFFDKTLHKARLLSDKKED